MLNWLWIIVGLILLYFVVKAAVKSGVREVLQLDKIEYAPCPNCGHFYPKHDEKCPACGFLRNDSGKGDGIAQRLRKD